MSCSSFPKAIRSFQDQLQKVDSKLRTGEFARPWAMFCACVCECILCR